MSGGLPLIEPLRGYTRSGPVHIAYQVLRAGQPDMVHVLPFGTPVEIGWELPQDSSMVEEDRLPLALGHLRPAGGRLLRSH
jgi:hypothetical protein